MTRPNHRQRIRDKAHAGVLATFRVTFYCVGNCRRDHTHQLRVFGKPDQCDLETPARIVRKWARAEKRNRQQRAKAARRAGVAPEPLDPIEPLSIAELRQLAKRRNARAS